MQLINYQIKFFFSIAFDKNSISDSCLGRALPNRLKI